MQSRQPKIIFKKTQHQYLKNVHHFLNQMYHAHIFPTTNKHLEQNKIHDIKQMETMWMDFEKNECLNQYDCYQPVTESNVIAALNQHTVYQHKLFNYLKKEADLADFKTYIIHESVLNLEFFDYLAFAIIGTSDQVKAEIISNLWDEAGKGHIEKFHTNMFKSLLADLGLKFDRKKIIENMPWEGLAGINLFSYLAISPQHKMKYFGLLAATEMIDPFHYHHLLQGMNRVFKGSVDYSYYSEHVVIDIEHAKGWLNKVILPELKQKPHERVDFWLGFYMRLNSMERYYNHLYYLFSAKLAA